MKQTYEGNVVYKYFKEFNRKKLLEILFQITILSSFWGPVMFSFTVPGVGEIYLFRIFLVLFLSVFIFDVIKRKYNPFKQKSAIEYAVFALVGVMVIYSFISLFNAIDFIFTFRKLFNLCFDLAFFMAIIIYINDKKTLVISLINITMNILLLQVLGVYEIFFGGIFYDYYNEYKRFVLFDKAYQFPLVSYGNANNYVSSLLLCLPIILTFLLIVSNYSKNKSFRKVSSILTVIMLTLSYFLAEAAKARLCILAILVLFAGYGFFILVHHRKQLRSLFTVFICVIGIVFMNRYIDIKTDLINYFSDKPEVTETTNQELVDSNEETVINEFVIVDEVTGETSLNISESGGVRTALILFSVDKLIDSRLMGAGLGNTEQMAKVVADEQFGGIWSIHCFPARIISDMGIFLIIPLLVLVFLILRKLIDIIKLNYKSLLQMKIVIVFVITSVLSFPLITTSPSDAQDLLSMWLYLAILVITIAKISQFNITNNVNEID